MSSPKLLDQVRTVARVKHYSRKTEDAYANWIKCFILFHKKRHPKEMAEEEIRQFLAYLAVDLQVSSSTQTVALSALLFLYRDVLKLPLPYIEDVERAKPSRRLPVVLSKVEVQTILAHLSGTHLLLASLLYGAGLRLMEAIRLRVKDVDFAGNQITVREGKGNVDRITMLPQSIKITLQEHLTRVKLLHQKDLKKVTARSICRLRSSVSTLMQTKNGAGSMSFLRSSVHKIRVVGLSGDTTLHLKVYKGPSRPQSNLRRSQRTVAATHSVTALPLTSWKMATIFALFKSCSVTKM
jgi:site-specific recombinase XerD